MKKDLVQPGDITDAVDSDDLAQRFLGQNLNKIVDENDVREREKLAHDARNKIEAEYLAKAREVFQKLWKTCRQTHGHTPSSLQAGGYALRVCKVCGYAIVPEQVEGEGSNAKDNRRRHKQYNADRTRQLADQMLEVDVTAGLVTFKTADDFTGRGNGRRRPPWRRRR